jgi:hypothetical protein
LLSCVYCWLASILLLLLLLGALVKLWDELPASPILAGPILSVGLQKPAAALVAVVTAVPTHVTAAAVAPAGFA